MGQMLTMIEQDGGTESTPIFSNSMMWSFSFYLKNKTKTKTPNKQSHILFVMEGGGILKQAISNG